MGEYKGAGGETALAGRLLLLCGDVADKLDGLMFLTFV